MGECTSEVTSKLKRQEETASALIFREVRYKPSSVNQGNWVGARKATDADSLSYGRPWTHRFV